METNQIVRLIIFIAIPFLLIPLVNRIAKKIASKKTKNLTLSFLKNFLVALIVMICVIGVIDIFDTEHVISQRILMSSSVLAIVLGIVFQTGLTNLVHGIMLVIYRPFQVGDRVQMETGTTISGYVKQITLRHVVITNIIDNADLIIPNSVVETCVIKNLTNGKLANNRYPLIVSMTYEQAQDKETRELAKKIISDCILANGRTVDSRTDKTEDLFVKTDYSASSVDLTCFVETKSAEDNIIACSEIKDAILDEFKKNDIEFAYNHLQIVGKITHE